MSGLSDRTGNLTRVVGFGGLMLLVVTAVVLREPPPAAPGADGSGAGVAAAAPLPPAPPLPPTRTRVDKLFPVYPGAHFSSMGNMEANGNPMEMSYFDTASPAAEVLAFYREEFSKRGYHVVTEPDGDGGGAVNYYDPVMGALIAVTAVGVGSGRDAHTMVFPSIVEAPQGVHLAARAPESLPQPPGAMTVMRVDDRNSGHTQGSATVTQVAHGTPAMVADFYKTEMAARGFKQNESRNSKGVEMLDFERAGQHVAVSVSPVQKEGLPQSLITLIFEQVPLEKELKQ